jgi:hypothetical protein|nr:MULTISPECIES: relaxase/mobilization nuclease domain-containing protein [Sphingobacterium]
MGKVVKSGRSFKGCVEYCMLKKGAEVLSADGIRSDTVAHAIADFNMQRKMRPSLGHAVGHIALNWSPEDAPVLTDEIMVAVAREYLAKMKISDTQVLMVRHHDTKHPHLHIVYNRVNNEGRTIDDANQRWKNVRASKALTLKHGFHIATGKNNVNRQNLNGADKVKYQIHDQIMALLPKAKSMAELQKLLLKQGIGIQYKYRSGTDEVQGISFSKGGYQFKGSEIDRNYSFGKISLQLAKNEQMFREEGKDLLPVDKQEQKKSLADELREILGHSQQDSPPVQDEKWSTSVKIEPPTRFTSGPLGDLFAPMAQLSDDVDDEAIHGRNRRRTKKARTNKR